MPKLLPRLLGHSFKVGDEVKIGSPKPGEPAPEPGRGWIVRTIRVDEVPKQEEAEVYYNMRYTNIHFWPVMRAQAHDRIVVLRDEGGFLVVPMVQGNKGILRRAPKKAED
jgi:hypothetical protein